MRALILSILYTMVMIVIVTPALASTYNCFEVDKRASLGINGGVVNVDGDKSNRTCKFSVDNATVDSIGSRGGSLEAILRRPEELLKSSGGGLEQFREAILSPFSDKIDDSIAAEFNSVFAKDASNVASCIVNFMQGAAQKFGGNGIICVSYDKGSTFEFQGLSGAASESVLVIGASLEKSQRVLLLIIPLNLAQAVERGEYHFF
jgi:hypothetical protein